MTQVWLWIKTIGLVAIASGVLPFLYQKIKLAQAELAGQKVTTKTKNLSLALKFAEGAVGLAEKITGTGETQQASAVLALQQRLQENGLAGKFTDSQIQQLIQQAYSSSKASGALDTLKVDSSASEDSSSELQADEAKALTEPINDNTVEVNQ